MRPTLMKNDEISGSAVSCIPWNTDTAGSCRSAKLPIFSGESRASLEARIYQAHQLLGGKQNYTIVTPSFPRSPLDLSKRTYSNCSLSSKTDQTTTTVSSSGSESIFNAESVYSRCDPEEPSLLRQSGIGRLEATTFVADNSSDDCGWGYFVDSNAEEEYVRQPSAPQYRPFLSHVIWRTNGLKRR
jgi:hypothetical protein